MTRTRQLDLIRRLQALSPRPVLMGGFAEDALLHGGYSRDHGDVDLLVERTGLGMLLDQLRAFGYDDWVTKGENAGGEPFYLEQHDAGIPIELGVTDRSSGEIFMEVARVHYSLRTGEAPVGFRVHLPADTYDHPAVPFEGIPVRCISPLACFQLRAGFASRGTFGEPRPHDGLAMEQLRASFFPDVSEAALEPRVEDLYSVPTR